MKQELLNQVRDDVRSYYRHYIRPKHIGKEFHEGLRETIFDVVDAYEQTKRRYEDAEQK